MTRWIKKWVRPRDLSIEQKQELTKNQLQRMTSDLFQEMLKTFKNGQKLIDNNPYGLTRKQVIDGLGGDALEVIRLAILLKDCLNIAIPGTIPDDEDPYILIQK